MNVRVKVCGITRTEDAQFAAQCGAAAVGFNFWPNSPRYCFPEHAKAISKSLPPFVARVGVFVDSPADRIEEIVRKVGLSAVQLHGGETPQVCKQLSVPVIKALPASESLSSSELAAYDVAAFLLDAPSNGHGGSGNVFDWKIAERLQLHRPLILAGGLTPANVAQAIAAVHPYAVDVASGVEESPGIKDPEKVEAFFAAVGGSK